MENLVEHTHKVTKEDRQQLLKQKSPVIWLTGLSGFNYRKRYYNKKVN